MVKKKHRQRQKSRQANASRIRVTRQREGDSDDKIYDEVDKFNMEYDEGLLKLVRKPAKPLAREVLRVASDDEFSDRELLNESEAVGEEEYIPKNKWGKRRQNYYGSSLPKKEYGSKRSTTTGDDVLELEEEDALARQKKMESANACVNFDQFIDDDDKDEQRPQLELAQILNIQVKPVETKARSNNDLNAQMDEGDSAQSGSSDDDNDEHSCEVKTRERRKITYEIRKNKGIPKDKGRRKGKKHSRVMKKHQYKKALIKKRSQVPDVRRELTAYDGEKRGIRISTIKSIKL